MKPFPAAQPQPFNKLFLWSSAVLLLAGYLALGWIGCSKGISSLDANGIILVVNDELQTGHVGVSRPPGHPLNENWILPSLLRLAQAIGGDAILSPIGYGLYQLVGGVFCLSFFWVLLSELSLSFARRLLATACLAFSPQFLIQSADGEEFLWGLACIFATMLVLARLSAGTIKPLIGWSLGIALAVAASGYRLEYGAVMVLVALGTLLVSDRSWPQRLGFVLLALLLLAVVWFPVLVHHGLEPPFPNPLSLKTRIGVGLYKIIFHSLGLVPLLIGFILLFQARKGFRLFPDFRKNLLIYWSIWLVILFFALFFVYPTKILVVLPGVAFLIVIAATQEAPRLWPLFVLTCMSLPLLHLDCFQNRHWTGLKFQSSLWTQSLAGKPSEKGPELLTASRMASNGQHVLITRLAPWDLAYQKKNASWPGIPDSSGEMYAVGPGIVASRDLLDRQDLLSNYAKGGYDIWIDQALYREVYMRYDLFAPTPQSVVIEGIPYRIVEVQ